MRIDTHVHMPSQHNIWGIEHFSAREYLNFMDSLEIDKAFILPLDGLFFSARECNDALAKWCDADRSRLIPFFTFEPRDLRAREEITRCFETLGMKGVKLHTWLQGFRPTEECFLPLAEYLAELELPVLFHDGTPPYSTPLQIAEIAREFPKLKVVLGHGGLYDFSEETIAAANAYPNLSISMTSLPTFYMQKLIEKVDHNQLMFGSDGGLNSIEKHGYVTTRWGMYEAMNIDPAVRKKIEEENPLSIIGDSI